MANKRKIEDRQRTLRKKKTERTIQIAGIAIVALIAIGILWLTLPGKSTKVLELPQGAGKQYSAFPPMTIDVNKKYLATFKLAKGGEFVVQLFADKAPKTVNNFVFLARDGYYDGTTFHRVSGWFHGTGRRSNWNGRGRSRLSVRI